LENNTKLLLFAYFQRFNKGIREENKNEIATKGTIKIRVKNQKKQIIFNQ